MELYLPPSYAKIPKQSEWYKTTETFKRRSKASKEKMAKYWSDWRHRRRIDKKQAKPVDVFDMQGNFVATYQSSRKAAIGLFGMENYRSRERCIRACREGVKKSFLGYMFRDHQDGVTKIEPYFRKPKKRGYKVNRDRSTYAHKPVMEVCEFGILAEWPSLKECAASIGGTYGGLWAAMRENQKYKKKMIVFKNGRHRVGPIL